VFLPTKKFSGLRPDPLPFSVTEEGHRNDKTRLDDARTTPKQHDSTTEKRHPNDKTNLSDGMFTAHDCKERTTGDEEHDSRYVRATKEQTANEASASHGEKIFGETRRKEKEQNGVISLDERRERRDGRSICTICHHVRRKVNWISRRAWSLEIDLCLRGGSWDSSRRSNRDWLAHSF